jgi:hypothetical protein
MVFLAQDSVRDPGTHDVARLSRNVNDTSRRRVLCSSNISSAWVKLSFTKKPFGNFL